MHPHLQTKIYVNHFVISGSVHLCSKTDLFLAVADKISDDPPEKVAYTIKC